MKTRFILPILAVCGIAFAIFYSATFGTTEKIEGTKLTEPAATPYSKTVAGSGIVEASSRDIEVGSHLSGIVQEVLVIEGQHVTQGAPLFSLDTRQAQADVKAREASLALSQAQIAQAKVALADELDRLQRAQNLREGSSITVDELQRRRFAHQRAEASLVAAEASTRVAQAELVSALVVLEKLVVHAPVAGTVLKVRTEKGAFVSAGSQQAPVLMGTLQPLYVRATIDENDVWRFNPEGKAVAMLRSTREHEYALTFVRLEPYVQPKRSLTGDSTERVDTRVLEVLYEIQPNEAPLYVGQQMDVFIEAD